MGSASVSVTLKLPERIHIVGIGGIGMSAIARVLAARGHRVSGSDMRASPITEELTRLGIRVDVGHAAEHAAGAELVAVSSAIPDSNPEIQAARAAHVPVVKRSEFVGALMAGKRGIAVAGTHGKTTTTAMLAVILQELGLAPTFIVGGIVADLGTNSAAGCGEWFVIEADEYDRMFLGLAPEIAIVTNIEMDHPDCYRDLADMRRAYGQFLARVPEDGLVVACGDAPEVRRVLTESPLLAAVAQYGTGEGAHYRLTNARANARGGVAGDVLHEGTPWCSLSLGIPGVHNALNATAALVVAQHLGIAPETAAQVLGKFRGALRRFEVKGQACGVTVVDDYAHHPTEIRATLAATRQRYDGQRIWAVWQPHTFSRTQVLLGEFATCFGDADHVIILDTYAARAREVGGLDAERLRTLIRHPAVEHIPTIDAAVDSLAARLRPGDVLLTCSAGDGNLVGERVLTRFAG